MYRVRAIYAKRKSPITGFMEISGRATKRNRKKRNRTTRLQGIETVDIVQRTLLKNFKQRNKYLASIPCKCGILDGIVAKPSVGKNHNCIANIFMKKEKKELERKVNFRRTINSENEIRSFSIKIGRIHASHNPPRMDTTPAHARPVRFSPLCPKEEERRWKTKVTKRKGRGKRNSYPVAFDFREESEGRRHRPANRPGVQHEKPPPWYAQRRMDRITPSRMCSVAMDTAVDTALASATAVHGTLRVARTFARNEGCWVLAIFHLKKSIGIKFMGRDHFSDKTNIYGNMAEHVHRVTGYAYNTT
ncbi:hypothetical protein EAG_03634 [Camponotus floridanus]|uniref:Uncharacterized protein n=1 Tax=Camponotus floridanus TaxID=104421 RepID=E2AP31_CAMFO|nr:hypothetical protein EAG_03634 [Camponotus floridanus]